MDKHVEQVTGDGVVVGREHCYRDFSGVHEMQKTLGVMCPTDRETPDSVVRELLSFTLHALLLSVCPLL